MDDELRERLRSAADSHRPDRERMLARVERGMARAPAARAPRAPRAATPWLRVVGATAAVCGVLAAGAFAATSAGHGEGDGERVAGPPASSAPASPFPASPFPAPSTSAPSAPAPSAPASSASAPSAPASPDPTSPDPDSTAPVRGGALPVEDGPLWTDGSVDAHSNTYWAQSNVTLKTGKPLSALTVELRVLLNGEVATTGAWRSLPVEDFTASAQEKDGFLVYRWTLKEGRTVPAGTHTFAGQYNHSEGGRDAGRDDYTVRAGATGGGEQAAAGGDFSAAR